MTSETKDAKICSFHQCPFYACPKDCPNKLTLVPPRVQEVLGLIERDKDKKHDMKAMARTFILMRDNERKRGDISDEEIQEEIKNMIWRSIELSESKEKHFSKQQIVREIFLVAATEKITPEDFESQSEEEKFDAQGNLVYLSLKLKEQAAQERKCGNIWFIYTPLGENTTLSINRASSSIKAPDEVDWSEEVLIYSDVEQKWVKP